MKKYTVIETRIDGYDRRVICLTSESLFSYTKEIEAELAEEMKMGMILIDQLFLTGDGTNRFLRVEFANDRFDFATARTIIPAAFLKAETAEWLHEHSEYLENSILTEEQRRMIRENAVSESVSSQKKTPHV